MDRDESISPVSAVMAGIASGEASEPTIMAEPERVKVNLYGHMAVLNKGEDSHQEIIDAIHTVVDKLADKGEHLDGVLNFTVRVDPIDSEYVDGLQVIGTSEFHENV